MITIDHIRVLKAIGAFQIIGSETIRADLRCIFVELEIMGLIEPVKDYRLTKAGRDALQEYYGDKKENDDDSTT